MMLINDFRDFIEKHDLCCVELQWAENRRCEFIFVTNKPNTVFKVVYNADQYGALSFDRAHECHGLVDYFVDESFFESMLLHHQYIGLNNYRGSKVVCLTNSTESEMN